METGIPIPGLILRNETDVLRAECVTSLVSRESSRKARKILNAIYKPEPRTLAWILDDEGEIARWMSKDRGILWIRGDQGSGKSVAMKELYSKFERERDEEQVVIAYFFSNQSEEGGVEDLLRSVLASLLKQCPALFRGMKPWYDYSFPDGTDYEDWDVVCLQVALDLVLRTEHHPVSISLFVDAINEATDVSMEALMDIFQQLCKDDLHNGLKICFSGRFDPKNQQLASFKFPYLNLESKTNDDISIFVQSRFQGAKIDGPLDELNLLMINLIQRASGSWLWASFATQKLKDASNYGSDVNELKAQLDKFPPEIHNMYEEKVKEVRKEHIADLNKALAIAFMAQSPLSVDEFRYAWAYTSDDLVSLDGQFETPSFIPSAAGMARKIMSRCNGLLVIKYEVERENEEDDDENLGSSTVQFRHPTVKEYLSTKRRTSDSKLDDLESLQKRGSHLLSLATTRFLQCKEVHSLTGLLKSGVKLRHFDREKIKERMPLLDYSVHRVFEHSDQALRFDSGGKAEILNSWKPEEGLFDRWWFIWNSMFREILLPEGVTPLYMFISIGGTAFVKHLLDAHLELDVNRAIPLYGRYIILAAFNEEEDIIRLLLKTGADVNASCPRYGDALQVAAASGKVAIVNMLLDGGARIAPTGGRFHDPICAAAFSLNPQVLEILFRAASKSGFISNVGVESKALIWAVQAISDFQEQDTPFQVNQISKIVSILASHGFDYSMVSAVAVPVFWWYLSSGGVDTLKRLQINIRNVNARSSDGLTLTHLACLNGTSDTIRYLFEIGADFKIRDKNGRHPIHFAALNRDPQALEFVLSIMTNVDPDQPDSIGVTPLHGAVATGNLDCVRQLMKAGADFSIASIEGFTILHFAMFSGNQKVLDEIQNFASINIDAKDRWGRTALHFAFQYGIPDNVRWLLSKNPDTSCRDNDGRTILHAAAQTSSLEYQTLIDLAISHTKADLRPVQDFGGSTPCHVVFYDPPRVRSDLLWVNDGCAKFEEGLCSKKLGHLLSKKMVGVNVQDNSGNSALHLACWRGLVQSIRMLLQDGADPRLKDKHGVTPAKRLRDQTIQIHLETISQLLDGLEISNINPKEKLTITGITEEGSQS